jgi:hypothetical protein
MHLADEILKHLHDGGEVGDHAVLHGPYGGDVFRRVTQHTFGLHADRLDAADAAIAILTDRDHRMLVLDNALAAHVDQRIGGAKSDGEIVGKSPQEAVQHSGSAE